MQQYFKVSFEHKIKCFFLHIAFLLNTSKINESLTEEGKKIFFKELYNYVLKTG
jgi:hypothetical protein